MDTPVAASDEREARPRVLVVGAGPVGLALAIELGQRGVACLVVERNERVGVAPRAKTTNLRTREHMRRWGIARRLRAASPFGMDYPANVVFVTRLAGRELARFENALHCSPGRSPLYAEHSQWIPQYTVEEVLRAHAQSLPGVELRFNCELVELAQDGLAVEAQLADRASGRHTRVRADYLVGADGSRSRVRDAIGARMQGEPALSRNFNVVFRAPGLAAAHRHGPAIMYWQVNREAPSLIGPMDRGDKWFFMPTQVPEAMRRGEVDVAALIARATGIELPYEVLSTDEWTASRLIADRYRVGRVFLAGDACHLHPPFGGYGMNLGVGDAVDLGWKLAAVLQGWGGEGLLDSYEAERRPVHEWVLDEAVANHATLGNQLVREGLENDGPDGERVREEVGARIGAAKMREFVNIGVVLGYRYEDSPVIAAERGPAPGHDFVNYVPTSRPGGRAPHAWLHDGSSLFDHFGSGFTLLVRPGHDRDQIARASDDARAAGVPLAVIEPHEPGVAALYPSHCTLIRPDQHVAWRADAWPADGRALLARLTGRSTIEHG